jgi:hypothetical protein
VASAEEAAQAEQQLVNITRATKGEFTLRDEANALTAFSFRNGFLEDLHGGKFSPVLNEPGYSRISNEEMKRLMIEASEKLEQMLRMKREQPGKYEEFIRDYQRKYCWAWTR